MDKKYFVIWVPVWLLCFLLGGGVTAFIIANSETPEATMLRELSEIQAEHKNGEVDDMLYTKKMMELTIKIIRLNPDAKTAEGKSVKEIQHELSVWVEQNLGEFEMQLDL